MLGRPGDARQRCRCSTAGTRSLCALSLLFLGFQPGIEELTERNVFGDLGGAIRAVVGAFVVVAGVVQMSLSDQRSRAEPSYASQPAHTMQTLRIVPFAAARCGDASRSVRR